SGCVNCSAARSRSTASRVSAPRSSCGCPGASMGRSRRIKNPRRSQPLCDARDLPGKARGEAMAKILLVEDNEMNRDMLSRRLIRKGHTVLMALDGKEGVRMARTELPELILMDISLPEMDGWEATRILKADSLTRAIPIIALTAHALDTDRARAKEVGCDDF